MTRTRQLLGGVSAFALVSAIGAPASAEGTSAGTEITNSVSVTYSVSGTAQDAVSDTDTFYVDRKIDVVVAAVTASSTVQASQNDIVRQFTVRNDSNATVGFALSVGSDAALENVVIFDDSVANGGDGDGVYDAGEEITFIDALAEDATRTVSVKFDVAAGVANGTDVDLVLTANAHEANTGATSEIVASSGANTAGTGPTDIETVLADGAGTGDAQYAGDFSAAHALSVESANVSVNKTSTVISDPVVGTGTGSGPSFIGPKAIPGAVVEYCITVSNAAGQATATGISVSDDLSGLTGELQFLPNVFGAGGDIEIDGDATCQGGTPVDKGYTTATTLVSNGISDVAAGETRSLRFRTTIR